MEPTIASHEKRLLELNVQLDTKYREVFQAVADVSKKYPKRKPNKWQFDRAVIASRSRGVLTLNQNKFGPPSPVLKRPIPLQEKRGRQKELPLDILKGNKGKDVSADVHITHGEFTIQKL